MLFVVSAASKLAIDVSSVLSTNLILTLGPIISIKTGKEISRKIIISKTTANCPMKTLTNKTLLYALYVESKAITLTNVIMRRNLDPNT